MRAANRKGVHRAKIAEFVRKTMGVVRVEMGGGRHGNTTRPCTECAMELGRYGVTVQFFDDGVLTKRRADKFRKGETVLKSSRRRQIAAYRSNLQNQ